MKYIKVQENEVVGFPQDLPINFENISNFYLLPPDILRSYGWYPFEQEYLNLSENEKLVRWDIDIQSEKVVKKCIKRELTSEEVNHRNTSITEKKWQDVRERRNLLLLESDWTQLNDAQIGNKSEWTYYRQELRDITNNPNVDALVWPVKPLVIKPIPSFIETPPVNNTVIEEEQTMDESEMDESNTSYDESLP
jgi:hypothetical protein